MLTYQSLNDALFDVLGSYRALGAPTDDVTFSAGYTSEEARCYDFLVQARLIFDFIPAAALDGYESDLDESHWAAVVAWRLFLTETDELNEAIEVVLRKQESLTAMRRMGVATTSAVTQLMSSVIKDLAQDGLP